MLNGFWQFLARPDKVLFGTDLDDLILGGSGSDTIRGLKGDDFLFGGRGSDSLYGGAGNDLLWGGRGHDILNDGPGNDVLLGGRGRDKFIYSTAENIGGHDIFLGGSGRDQLVFVTKGQLSRQLLNDVELFEAQILAGNHKKFFSFSHTNLKAHSIEQLIVELAPSTISPIDLHEDVALPVTQKLNSQFVDVMTDVMDIRSDQLNFLQGPDGYHADVQFGNKQIADLNVSAEGRVTLTPLAGEIDTLSAGEVVHATFTATFQTEFGTQFRVPTSVRVIGQNDAPVFLEGDTSAELSRAMQGTVSGKYSFFDPDRNDSHELQVSADDVGYLGALSVTLAPGEQSVMWSFTLLPEELIAVPPVGGFLQTYSVVVRDSQGAFFEQTISIDLRALAAPPPLEVEVPVGRAIVEQIVLPEPVASPGGATFSISASSGGTAIFAESITVPEGALILDLPIKGDIVGTTVLTVTGDYATASGNAVSVNETISVEVVDTEQPLVVSAQSAQVFEHEDQAFVDVSLNQVVDSDVTVAFEILDGTADNGRDFSLPSIMNVTISANTSATRVAIPLIDDLLPEGTENLFLRITNASNQNGAVSFDPTPALVKILEDDKLMVSADHPFTIARGLVAEVSVDLEQPIAPGGEFLDVNIMGSDGLVAPTTIFVSDGDDQFTFDILTEPDANAGIAALTITDSSGDIIANTAVTISDGPLLYDSSENPLASSFIVDSFLFG